MIHFNISNHEILLAYLSNPTLENRKLLESDQEIFWQNFKRNNPDKADQFIKTKIYPAWIEIELLENNQIIAKDGKFGKIPYFTKKEEWVEFQTKDTNYRQFYAQTGYKPLSSKQSYQIDEHMQEKHTNNDYIAYYQD